MDKLFVFWSTLALAALTSAPGLAQTWQRPDAGGRFDDVSRYALLPRPSAAEQAAFSLRIAPPVPVIAEASAPDLTLWPNPAQGMVRIALPAGAASASVVYLFDALGRVARTQSVAAGATSILLPLAGVPAGLYLVQLGGVAQRLVVE